MYGEMLDLWMPVSKARCHGKRLELVSMTNRDSSPLLPYTLSYRVLTEDYIGETYEEKACIWSIIDIVEMKNRILDPR